MTVTVVYAVMAAVLGTVFLRPAMSLFFCRRYKCHDAMGQDLHEHLCGVFYPVGCDLCIQERDAGMRIRLFCPWPGGIAELLARLVTAVFAMKMGSYVLTCFCHPAAWTAAAVFLWVSYERVIRKAEREKRAEDPQPHFNQERIRV